MTDWMHTCVSVNLLRPKKRFIDVSNKAEHLDPGVVGDQNYLNNLLRDTVKLHHLGFYFKSYLKEFY